jgi:hypothetical protein
MPPRDAPEDPPELPMPWDGLLGGDWDWQDLELEEDQEV